MVSRKHSMCCNVLQYSAIPVKYMYSEMHSYLQRFPCHQHRCAVLKIPHHSSAATLIGVSLNMWVHFYVNASLFHFQSALYLLPYCCSIWTTIVEAEFAGHIRKAGGLRSPAQRASLFYDGISYDSKEVRQNTPGLQ